MKKKLMDYQKQWKARRGHILKAPFHVPDAKKHVEKDIYVLDKKALHEQVVDLQFDKTDLEHYDTLNSDATFLKESCKNKTLCKQLYDWLGYEIRFLVVCNAIAQYQSCPLDDAPALSAGTAPAPEADKSDNDEGAGGAGGEGAGGAGGAAGEALQRGLTAEQRAERGLPPVRQQRQARTKHSQQLAQAAKHKRGQDEVPQGGAAEASDESDISPALKTPLRYVIFA